MKLLLRATLALGMLALLLAGWVAIQWKRVPAVEPYLEQAMPQAFPVPGKLTIRHAGVSTLVFDDGETVWMTDAFLSRPPLKAMFGKIAPDAALVERQLARLYVKQLAAVVPLHTHYDHALDSALVAERTGALLVGSESAMQLGRGHGLPAERLREVKSGDTLQLGKFKLTLHRLAPQPDALDRRQHAGDHRRAARVAGAGQRMAHRHRSGRCWSSMASSASWCRPAPASRPARWPGARRRRCCSASARSARRTPPTAMPTGARWCRRWARSA